MLNNPKLDVVNIYAYAKYVSINDYANFGQNPFIRSQDIERKRNSDVIQGRNSLRNKQKLTLNPKLDTVNIYVYAKYVSINDYASFGQNPFIHSQVIERK